MRRESYSFKLPVGVTRDVIATAAARHEKRTGKASPPTSWVAAVVAAAVDDEAFYARIRVVHEDMPHRTRRTRRA